MKKGLSFIMASALCLQSFAQSIIPYQAVSVVSDTSFFPIADIQTAKDGTIYMVGSNDGKVQITRYDSDFNALSDTIYNLGNNLSIKHIRVDQNNSIYIGGETYDSASFTLSAYQDINSGLSYSDVYLAKINANGNIDWATHFGGSNNDFLNDMALDSIGRLFITGYTQSNDLPPTSGLVGLTDAFVSSINSSTGFPFWSRVIGGDSADQGAALITGPNNVYIGGNTKSSDFPNDTTYAGNQQDIFILSLDADSGILNWSNVIIGDNNQTVTDMAWGIDGFYMAVNTNDYVDYPNVFLPAVVYANGYDVFLVKMDTQGNFQRSSYFGGASDDLSAKLLYDSKTSQVFVLGSTESDSLMYTSSDAFHNVGDLVDTQNIFLASFNDSLTDINYSSFIAGDNPDTLLGASFTRRGIAVLGKYTDDTVSFTNPVTGNQLVSQTFLLEFASCTLGSIELPDYESCNGDSILLDFTWSSSDSSNIFSYEWTQGQGDILSTERYLDYLVADTNAIYNLQIIDSLGCVRISDSSLVSTYECDCFGDSCVWPGDANRDGTADAFDILNIGLAYGSVGPVRLKESILWEEQFSKQWDEAFGDSMLVNYKHADCDGNGIVDSSDISVIETNYGKMRQKRMNLYKSQQGASLFYIDLNLDSAKGGEVVNAKIIYGDEQNPTDSIYGLAFRISYNTSLVNSNSILFDFSNSWIGEEGVDMETISYNNTSQGYLDIGITRIDHRNVANSGEIGGLEFVMQDDLIGAANPGIDVEFTLNDIKIIDVKEKEFDINFISDTIESAAKDSSGTSINNRIENNIHLFPNPAKDQINIKNINTTSKLIIRNAVGTIVYQKDVTKRATVNLSEFKNGMYIVTLVSSDGIEKHTKFQVLK